MKRIYETSSNPPFPGVRKRRDHQRGGTAHCGGEKLSSQALPTKLQEKKNGETSIIA